eukprot:c11583_g1_i1.p1 GENE.c11583_g1_i1~~c11583_g1_i1.p1  ORF type:complete len:661 (+),score=178.13 c11583_g1_i1:56-2038(+)
MGKAGEHGNVKVRVTFFVSARTSYGEFVYVTGNHPKLGAWDVDRAVKLTTSASSYPVWSAEVRVTTPHTLEYKYLLKRPPAVMGEKSEFLKWEEISQNRTACLEAGDVHIKDGMFGDDYSAQRTGRVALVVPVGEVVDAKGESPGFPSSPPLSPIIHPMGHGNDPPIILDLLHPTDQAKPLRRIVLLQYKLPVEIVKNGSNGGVWEFSFLGAPMHTRLIALAAENKGDAIFVGTLDLDVPEDQHQQVQKALDKINCVGVFCDAKTKSMHYEYCKRVLWPALHQVPSDGFADQQSRGLWDAYSRINRAFAEQAVGLHGANTIFWIHGYQLLEVAAHIRHVVPESRIGLTQHEPFPSSDQLRALTSCTLLLHGLLSCSVVGFLLFDHARHFMSSCRRMKGVEFQSIMGGTLSMEYQRHTVTVCTSHVTIDPGLFHNLRSLDNESPLTRGLVKLSLSSTAAGTSKTATPTSPTTLTAPNGVISRAGGGAGWSVTVSERPESATELADFKAHILAAIPKLPNGAYCKIVLGIDTVDYLTGIPLKLMAFQHLLRDYKEWVGKVVLLQVSIARMGVVMTEAVAASEAKTAHLIQTINNDFASFYPGTNGPVINIAAAPLLESRKFLYSIADVLLLTNIRDGLNVIPYEFVCCKYTQVTHDAMVRFE